MILFLVISGWLLLGLLNIYLDGINDKLRNTKFYHNQEFGILIISGPIMTAIILLTICFHLFDISQKNSILMSIYKKGYGIKNDAK